jgi:hypothetical protein
MGSRAISIRRSVSAMIATIAPEGSWLSADELSSALVWLVFAATGAATTNDAANKAETQTIERIEYPFRAAPARRYSRE